MEIDSEGEYSKVLMQKGNNTVSLLSMKRLLLYSLLNCNMIQLSEGHISQWSSIDTLWLILKAITDFTPLHLAAILGMPGISNLVRAAYSTHDDLIKLLISQDSFGRTPLHIAVIEAEVSPFRVPEAIKLLELVDAPNLHFVIGIQDGYGQTILHKAVHNDTVFRYILRLLCSQDRLSLLKMQDNEGQTPMHTSKMSGLHSMFAVSIETRQPFKKTYISELLALKDIKDNTVLHPALAQGSVAWEPVLFSIGTEKLVDILKSLNKDGFSPLHWAVGRNTKHYYNIGETVNFLGRFGEERLHVLSLQLPTRQTFSCSIDRDGVTIQEHRIDKAGDTILHTIARRGCASQLYDLLINLDGAEITSLLSINNSVNETALQVSARRSDLLSKLLTLLICCSVRHSLRLQTVMDKSPTDETGQINRAVHLELLKMQNILGDTVLHKFASYCVDSPARGENVFECLSAMHLDSLLSICNKRQETAFHAAVRHGNIWYVNSVFDKLKELPERILSHFLMKDCTGSTPLHTAVYHVDDKLLSCLLSKVDEDASKALLGTADNDGNTPAHLALELNEIDKLNLLLELSAMRAHHSTLLAENEEGKNVLDLIGDKLSIWKRLIKDILGKCLVITCPCTLPWTV